MREARWRKAVCTYTCVEGKGKGKGRQSESWCIIRRGREVSMREEVIGKARKRGGEVVVYCFFRQNWLATRDTVVETRE